MTKKHAVVKWLVGSGIALGVAVGFPIVMFIAFCTVEDDIGFLYGLDTEEW